MDARGNPLVPVYPPEYFADMATHHKKDFLDELAERYERHPWEALPSGVGHWRLLDALPCLDAEHFGEQLPNWKYEDVYGCNPVYFFRSLFTIHDGELLGVETEWQFGWHLAAFNRECIHVQYARNQSQHNHMKWMHLPGTQGRLPGVKSSKAAAKLTWEEYESIGPTLVTRLNPPAQKKGKVVTWPQLFHLGAIHNFTALEIFACGCHMELMMSTRDRSKGSRPPGGYGHN